jgi:hypothetical protein
MMLAKFGLNLLGDPGRNGHGGEWRTSCSEREAGTAKKSRTGTVKAFGPHFFLSLQTSKIAATSFSFPHDSNFPVERSCFRLNDLNDYLKSEYCSFCSLPIYLNVCFLLMGMIDRMPKKNADCIRRGRTESDVSRLTEVQDYRIFASTWNVGGKSPSKGLDLDEWLHSSPPADIYILGFQEIVPLNAGNVLGTEDNVPAKKWVSLIRRTLNRNPGASSYGGYHTPSPVPDPVVELDADFEGSSRRHDNLSFFHRRSFQNLSQSLRVEGNYMSSQPRLDRRFSVCDPVSLGGRPSDFDGNFPCAGSPDDEYIEEDGSNGTYFSPFPYGYGTSIAMEENDEQPNTSRYCLVASKQMVGIFLTVWVRSELRNDVKNLKVSCVGRGLMGYLGNKGSISISMSLHHTSFCFICCHLTSGEKEGDELRRNSDVMEILRKTRFPRVRGAGDIKSPETILEHEYEFMFPTLHCNVEATQHLALILHSFDSIAVVSYGLGI